MTRCLNEPQRVGLDSILIARHLLLLVAPFRQFDLVREQVTPSQNMPQPKRRPQSPQALSRLPIPAIPMLNLHEPVIISVALEPRHTISRDFVLEVDIGHRRTVIMRVEMFLRGYVAELDAHPGGDVL